MSWYGDPSPEQTLPYFLGPSLATHLPNPTPELAGFLNRRTRVRFPDEGSECTPERLRLPPSPKAVPLVRIHTVNTPSNERSPSRFGPRTLFAKRASAASLGWRGPDMIRARSRGVEKQGPHTHANAKPHALSTVSYPVRSAWSWHRVESPEASSVGEGAKGGP